MKLYHGTSARHLDAIKREGITPRKTRKDDGNWKHSIASCPKAIYLTNSYAIHYAQAAADTSEQLLILEIETARIDQSRFTPDEDFLEQSSRKQPVSDANGNVLLPGLTMKKRTLWFRNRLLQFAHLWEDSIRLLGNCCYHGVVPPRAFTRYALLPSTSAIAFMSDPTITLLNYHIMGGFYRELTKYVFGEDIDMKAALFPDQLERLVQVTRKDVVVQELPS